MQVARGRWVGTSVRPAAPKLKYPRARDQRTWIFRRTFEVKQRGLHFVAAGDRLRNDQVGRRIESRPWEGFRFTFYFDRLDDLDFRPADAGFQEVGIELAPDCMIAARAPDDLRIRPGEEGESGFAWMARPTIEIGVLHYQDSARAYRLPHTAKHLYRLCEMLQDETSVDDIVSSTVVPMTEIHGLESDVGQTSRCGGLTRQSELYVVHIDSGHQGWSNQRCDLKSDIASAATQVDRIHARPQASPAEQGSCLRPPGSRENLEPFVSLLATPYDVAAHERDYPRGVVGLR